MRSGVQPKGTASASSPGSSWAGSAVMVRSGCGGCSSRTGSKRAAGNRSFTSPASTVSSRGQSSTMPWHTSRVPTRTKRAHTSASLPPSPSHTVTIGPSATDTCPPDPRTARGPNQSSPFRVVLFDTTSALSVCASFVGARSRFCWPARFWNS